MEWISVKDRLPEVDKEVIVFVCGISYNSGKYEDISISSLIKYYTDSDNGIEWACKMTCNEEVSHWMPLPEPPIEKKYPENQTCTFCLKPESILTPETCCTGCSLLKPDKNLVQE